MRYFYFFIALLLCLAVVTSIAYADTVPSPSASPEVTTSPSASPTATPSPTPPPVSRETIAKGHRIQVKARVWYRKWTYARHCWGMSPVRVSLRHPSLHATEALWQEYIVATREARDTFKEKYLRLYSKAKNPGGGGWERWRPLAMWTWPHYLVPTVIQIIRWESGGSPYVWNHEGSGAFGLMQLLPKPSGVWSPLSQLRYAYLHKYVDAGGWAPWAGCAAF